MSEVQFCPCGTEVDYEHCCGQFHCGAARPETAEQLMRSRYSAWALQLIDYLIATTWPRQQRQLQRKALEEWANATEWQQLKIVNTLHGDTDDTTGEVEFHATYRLKKNGKTDTHQERSAFIKEDNQWYFIVSTTVTSRNDPCPCGSGKKYKKCCMP